MSQTGTVWEYVYTPPANRFSVVHYFRNQGNVYDNNNTLDWRWATDRGFEILPPPPADRVAVQPDPPVNGSTLRVVYTATGGPIAGSTSINLYRGLNGWSTILSQVPMSPTGVANQWSFDWPIPAGTRSIEFVFNNGNNVWDNNNEEDWHFRTVEPVQGPDHNTWMLH
jgi:hypothetical protein